MRLSLFFACVAVLTAIAVSPAFAADDGTTLKVKEGDKAPDISLPVTAAVAKFLPSKKDAKEVKLSDFQGEKGKNVVLYFYPKAMTPGCTKESCAFRDRIEKFADLDTVIIGISEDNLADQEKFTEKEKLNFPLFADNEQKAAMAFGTIRADKKTMTRRETFVIDKKGVIRKIYTEVKPEPHPDEVFTWIKENLK
jgi:peroxiredoxin Q/BCP